MKTRHYFFVAVVPLTLACCGQLIGIDDIAFRDGGATEGGASDTTPADGPPADRPDVAQDRTILEDAPIDSPVEAQDDSTRDGGGDSNATADTPGDAPSDGGSDSMSLPDCSVDCEDAGLICLSSNQCGSCRAVGTGCGASSDCCGSGMQLAACTAPNGHCCSLPPNGACNMDIDCCYGGCGTVSQFTCGCKPASGSPCTSNMDCCSRLCCDSGCC